MLFAGLLWLADRHRRPLRLLEVGASAGLNLLADRYGLVDPRTFPGVAIQDIDRATLVFARTHGHPAGAERAVAAYSRAGEHAACWLALGLIGAASTRRSDRRRQWFRGMRIVAGSYVVNQVIKFVVRRPRPELGRLPPLTPVVTRLSFPSAHATTSFAAARAYAGLAPAGPLYAAAVAFALSRPYLGVHYPSDVLAGAALGTAVATAWPAPHPRQPELQR